MGWGNVPWAGSWLPVSKHDAATTPNPDERRQHRSVLQVKLECRLVHFHDVANGRHGTADVAFASRGGGAPGQEAGTLRGQRAVADQSVNVAPAFVQAVKLDLMPERRDGLCPGVGAQKRGKFLSMSPTTSGVAESWCCAFAVAAWTADKFAWAWMMAWTRSQTGSTMFMKKAQEIL